MKAGASGVEVMQYATDLDHVDSDAVKVLNNIRLNIAYKELLMKSDQLFSLNTAVGAICGQGGRPSFSSHVAFSWTYGQGWEEPYPHLSSYSSHGLNRAGVSASMSPYIQQMMGMELHTIGTIAIQLYTPNGTVLFGDEERQKECSDHLALKLKFDKSVFFEGSTWAQLRQHQQQMGVHCDTLNDLTLGYKVTGVLSFIIFDCNTGEGSHLCAIGYT